MFYTIARYREKYEVHIRKGKKKIGKTLLYLFYSVATFLRVPFLIWSNYAAIVNLGGFSIGVAVFSQNRLSP